MQVNDPHGRAWTVKRQLIRLPRWRGVRKPRYDSKDWANVGSSPSGVEDLAFGTVLEALAWPLVVLLGEFVVAVPLAAARLLLGRWTVVASSGRERHTWHIRGRAGAATFLADVARALEQGARLPFGASVDAIPAAH